MVDIKIYSQLPREAMDIRIKVFVDEQGFVDDVDEIDAEATHFVAYIGEKAIGTCRAYKQADGAYIVGRIAVLRESRGQGIGSCLLNTAETNIKNIGGARVLIHAQLHAKGFYEFCGYTAFGDIEYEQGQPHIWLEKKI
ncbi:MAG: GNAT family N-acetyltransferase [Ruminococcaceae bacterium]|nr:GNAT family N-acetyltransferase [Oscillospiraceae bacterium]